MNSRSVGVPHVLWKSKGGQSSGKGWNKAKQCPAVDVTDGSNVWCCKGQYYIKEHWMLGPESRVSEKW